jgi:hypothetical protein
MSGVTEEWGPTMMLWASLTFTAFVVLITSSRLYDEWNCDKKQGDLNLSFITSNPDDYSDVCARVKYSVSVGVVSTAVPILWILGSQFFKGGKYCSLMEMVLSWLLFIMWIFAITYTTFSSNAPAKGIGNLYFFTWASFVVTVYMAMMSGKNWWMSGGETTTPEKAEETKPELKEGDVEGQVKFEGASNEETA